VAPVRSTGHLAGVVHPVGVGAGTEDDDAVDEIVEEAVDDSVDETTVEEIVEETVVDDAVDDEGAEEEEVPAHSAGTSNESV
jgi:hypothetical protein